MEEQDRIQELHKQLCQMHLKFHRLEKDRDEQAERANALEQLLNGYESNNPQEALLTKELELADACQKIEGLEHRVMELETKNNAKNEEERLSQRRTFQLQNLRQQSFKMKRARSHSFRLPRQLNLKDDEAPVIDDIDDTTRLKILGVQLQAMEEQKDFYAKKCQSQESTINALKKELQSDDRLLQSVHKKIMQTQIEALEEERDVYVKKCQSQERTIEELRRKSQQQQHHDEDPLLASLAKKMP